MLPTFSFLGELGIGVFLTQRGYLTAGKDWRDTDMPSGIWVTTGSTPGLPDGLTNDCQLIMFRAIKGESYSYMRFCILITALSNNQGTVYFNTYRSSWSGWKKVAFVQ